MKVCASEQRYPQLDVRESRLDTVGPRVILKRTKLYPGFISHCCSPVKKWPRTRAGRVPEAPCFTLDNLADRPGDAVLIGTPAILKFLV
jgi:hypothetical protein